MLMWTNSYHLVLGGCIYAYSVVHISNLDVGCANLGTVRIGLSAVHRVERRSGIQEKAGGGQEDRAVRTNDTGRLGFLSRPVCACHLGFVPGRNGQTVRSEAFRSGLTARRITGGKRTFCRLV